MLLVSACLVGERCRYDGRGYDHHLDLVRLVAEGRALPVCPEALGGLGTPRPPAELSGGDGADVLAGRARVVTADGTDVTAAFLEGAERALAEAVRVGATEAVLKRWSPSCGCDGVYAGAFDGTRAPGPGVAAARLLAAGIAVRHEGDPR